MITHTWSRFIALVAFTSAIISGIAINLVYPGGHTELPPITIGTYTFVVSLITAGFIPAAVYVVSNLLDAFAPQVSPTFNRLGYIGSWFALAAFSLAIVLTLGAWLAGGSNVQAVLESPAAYVLIIGLWLFALLDVSVFQRRKNRSLARHVEEHNTFGHRDNVEVLRNSPAPRSVPLIEHADLAIVINARGQALDLDFTNGIPARLQLLEAATPQAAGTA